jgi:NADPH:quinone reductase
VFLERTMRAILVPQPGGPEAMTMQMIDIPTPAPTEVLVRVHAAALNHADLLQRGGEFPAPSGECNILGVDIAGDVISVGAASAITPGTPVFGLVSGGGYADYCRLDADMAMTIPAGFSYAAAAALPEVCFTAETTLFQLGGLSEGQSVLVHGGSSGIGSMCIQMAKAAGARVACTVGSAAKAERARAIGADFVINYRRRDFVHDVLAWTNGAGVDVIEDIIGADYFDRNLEALKEGGCLVQVGVISGTKCKLDLDKIILKRLQIKGSIMRPLAISEKRRIAQRFRDRWLPLFSNETLKPIIDSIFPLSDVAEAHLRMEKSQHFGKIVLEVLSAKDVPIAK